MRKFKGFKVLSVVMVLMMVLVLQSVVVADAKTKYSKEEKEIAKILADMKDCMKDADSFQVKKLYKCDYTPSSDLCELESYNHDVYPSESYKYKIEYSAKNGFGGTNTSIAFANKGDLYFPSEDYYAVGMETNGKETKYKKTQITKIMNLANKYYEEY